MRYTILLFSIISLVSSCSKEKKDLVNKFSDTLLINIADQQDRRDGENLAKYLEHADPLYRKEAAVAFASIQDSTYAGHLVTLLLDADTSVRKAAAYALGQTPSVRSERILFDAVSTEKNNAVLAQLIESYGKVCKVWKLNLAAGDSILSSALAWSYYRMAVRGLADSAMNENATEFLKSSSTTTRLAAAHYFARGAKDFDNVQDDLIEVAKHDKSSEVRMAAAFALRKIKSDLSHSASEYIVKNDSDYRVRVNAVRALQEYPLEKTKSVLITALSDSNVNVGIAASETIKGAVTKEHWREISAVARATKDWRMQANLYEAALSVSNHKELAEEIRSLYTNSKNQYQKAALLTALQHSLMSYGFVREQLVKSPEAVLKVSAASALAEMNRAENFDAKLKPEFANIYKAAVLGGDAAVIGVVCDVLADSTLNYKSVVKDFSFLKEARNKLSLPKDFESIAPLETAIAYFEGKKNSQQLKNEFNHPIPWEFVRNIPRDQKAIIKTSKGNISIRLFVEEAPGSVANFISLALEKYYDGKFIHRVAPNFVVQGGCPRGDGWGSEDYSIRSEFSPRRYQTGSIGMASAGKDTEGTQWFITHSPTPHLDGRYTLFGEVETGMEIVHKIEVGDKIISVEIIDLKPL